MEKAHSLLKTGDADGIILRDVKGMEKILAHGLPAVVVGHRQTEMAGRVNVVTDSPAIGRMGAEHLLGCGFQHFAFCGFKRMPTETNTWAKIRETHFTERLRTAGFAPAHFELAATSPNWSRELQQLSRWLATLPKPLGLMAANDDCSQRVMEACKLAGLSVPDMVGVIGVDNDEVICGLTDPPMSSIAVNFKRAGYEAAQALDGLMRKSAAVPLRITAQASHIVARRSTDFVAVADSHLAKALRFIRDQGRNLVSVDDVARAAGLSRRALEKRFRKVLERSILAEIRRVHTDQIARVLVETDLPVNQIAERHGFANPQHFARYFRAGKKQTPLAYRQAFGRKHATLRAQNGDSFTQSGV